MQCLPKQNISMKALSEIMARLGNDDPSGAGINNPATQSSSCFTIELPREIGTCSLHHPYFAKPGPPTHQGLMYHLGSMVRLSFRMIYQRSPPDFGINRLPSILGNDP